MSEVATRREFLCRTAAAMAAGSMRSLRGEEPSMSRAPQGDEPVAFEELVPIVDTHQHLWDLRKFDLPWLAAEKARPLRRNFLMSDYLQATRGLNVVKTVYMEVNVAPDQQAREAEHVIALCRRDDNPMAAAVIGGSPHEKGFAALAEKYGPNEYVRGFRTVLHDPDRPQGLCLRPRFVENMKRLGKLGLSFDLCLRPAEIADGAKLAEKCPHTRFIIDHCGNMPVTGDDRALRKQWMAGMKAAAALENTVCKISGIVVTAKTGSWKPADLAPNIEFCLETFGEDRVFFGGDWPVCTLKATYAEWVDALKWIVRERSPEFRKKLFHDNAVKFYGLKAT